MEDATDGTINNILWFERDNIAEALGYRDWDAYEEGWSEADLKDAEAWFEGLDMHDLQSVSGLYVEDYEDEESFVDAANVWWEGLDDEKKVEIYYQND